jgi:hypothetical protein
MKCPWSVKEEMEEYVRKHEHVSSACRLTPDEELLLLKLCNPSARTRLSVELTNRKAYITAVTEIANLPPDKASNVNLVTEKMPSFENFDIGADTSILDNPKNSMVSAKLFGAAYSRPEEVSHIYKLINISCVALHHDIYNGFD